MVKISNFGPKFQLIKQLRSGTFVDLCVMVVKKFYINAVQRTELYVTDYTENDKMFYYTPPEELGEQEREGDQFGYNNGPTRSWLGPYGHTVLKVNTRHPHSMYANLWGEDNQILILRNVKMKAMNDYSNLEGDMWPDDQNLGKNNVRRLQPNEHDLPEVHELLERKEKYDQGRAVLEHQHIQATVFAHINNPQAQSGKGSKKAAKAGRNERKKEEKKKAIQQQKQPNLQAEQDSGIALRVVTGQDPVVLNKVGDARPNANVASRSADPLWQLNHNIRANYPQVQTTAVLDVLDHQNRRHLMKDERGETMTIPFANVRARTLVRVVDFQPSLEHFAIQRSQNTGSELTRSSYTTLEPDYEYEWRFRLQLEDASTETNGKPVRGPDGKPVRFVVEVFHQDAQYLLGNNTPDPSDLSKNPRLLAQLREKMCILWGNLEEWKKSNWTLKGGLKNKPFVCCIAEYGVEAKEGDSTAEFAMRKCYKLTDTTIMLG
nr:protection of telomeres protein 1 [Quercus suber]